MSLRVVFMGTPQFSVPTLAEIIGAGHDVVCVYSQPPRPAGRGMADTPSPVHTFAAASGIAVRTPRTLRDAAEQEAFAALMPDVAVVVAYGLILPLPVLAAPRHGCLNLHASALPRWRGAAPIQRAIMAGDTSTAAMVMRMEEGLDTGPVCLAEFVAIGPDTTSGELAETLSHQGGGLVVRALAALERDSLQCTPQSCEGATYAAKIDKAETRIDWRLPARAVHDHIRGLSPFPGAWFESAVGGKPERIKVLRSTLAEGITPVDGITGVPGTVLDDALTVACGEGAIRLVEVQRAGKRPMTAGELLRGFALTPGTRIG